MKFIAVKFIAAILLAISIATAIGFFAGIGYVIQNAEIANMDEGFTLTIFDQVHLYE